MGLDLNVSLFRQLTPEHFLTVFLPQEPENQVITAGRSLTLSCFVSAEKPVQYYWYKMSTLPSGDMTSDDNLYLAG